MNSVAVLLGVLIPPVHRSTASRLRLRWVRAWSEGLVTGTGVRGWPKGWWVCLVVALYSSAF